MTSLSKMYRKHDLYYEPSSRKKKLGRMKFTPEEDSYLKSLVKSSGGDPNWKIIAEQLGNGRKARQCRERYKNYLSPKLKNGPWTPEEEKFLEEKYNQFGPKWSKIAKFFKGRSDVNLKNHYVSMLNRKSKEEFEKRKKMRLMGESSHQTTESEDSEYEPSANSGSSDESYQDSAEESNDKQSTIDASDETPEISNEDFFIDLDNNFNNQLNALWTDNIPLGDIVF